jgi:hypothetical protein
MMSNFSTLEIVEVNQDNPEWLTVENERNINASEESVQHSRDFVAA